MSFFSKLFPTKLETFPVLIDMHSHLLPGIDDGAKSIEESIELIKELKKLGFIHFICTPHIMGDYYLNTPETIKKAFDLLYDEIVKQGLDVELGFAAEYYIDESFSRKLANKEKLLCIKDNYVLVETSYINKPLNFKEVIFELQMAGYVPVLAHPERYAYLYNDYKQFKEIHDLGVLFQINLNSICGHYSPACKKIVQKLIDDKLVDFIGTDCHNMRHIDVLKRVLKEKYTLKLTSLNLLNKSLV